MCRRFLQLFAALAVWIAPASAQPALWSISDEDTVVHLFGTVHTLPSDLDWRTDSIDAAFDAADTFCVETDIVGRFGDVLRVTLREGLFAGDERLSHHLTRDQQARLAAFAAELDVLYHGLDVQKPWNVMMTLSQALAKRSGFDSEAGVEMRLLPEATASGKAICEMESPSEHVTSISRLPLDVQIAALIHDAEAHDEVGVAVNAAVEELRTLVDNWAAGDVAALDGGGPDSFGHPDFYDALLTNRNQNWLPRIEALLDDPGVKFVAVGAAHLSGPDSVIEMLKERGHQVEGP
ncbi:MAG: TraB/GumN family protein [Pseudomonadota bacterium]